MARKKNSCECLIKHRRSEREVPCGKSGGKHCLIRGKLAETLVKACWNHRERFSRRGYEVFVQMENGLFTSVQGEA